MQIFGKDIKPEAISMWLNLAGLIASLIFYCTVEHTISLPSQPGSNPLQDTLFKVDDKLTHEVSALRHEQDSLLLVLQQHEQKLNVENQLLASEKGRIISTLHSDWDTLSQNQRESYTNNLIKKLKTHKR